MSNSAVTSSAQAQVVSFATAIAAITFSVPVWLWSRIKTAATHNGVFHADELLGYCLLLEATRAKIELIRSRDPKELKRADIVFDVGEGQYDHHGGRAGLDPCGIPWAGVTRLWWDGLCEALLPDDRFAQQWFYDHVLVPVALQDNGKPLPEGVQHPFNWVHYMNPVWDAAPDFDEPDLFDSGFIKAVTVAKPIVAQFLSQAKAASRARSVLEDLPQGDDIVVIKAGLPGWAEYLSKCTRAKFVVYHSADGTWYAQCVPEEFGDRFSKQVPFPNEWAGKRDAALEEASGITGAIFCHVGAFISGWKTREAAEDACRKVLKMRFQDES